MRVLAFEFGVQQLDFAPGLRLRLGEAANVFLLHIHALVAVVEEAKEARGGGVITADVATQPVVLALPHQALESAARSAHQRVHLVASTRADNASLREVYSHLQNPSQEAPPVTVLLRLRFSILQ
eukprot:446316-Rhodomonas_salina.2